MKREIGYYWVKLKRVNSEWEVAFWAPSGWSLTGLQRGYIDRDFEKIDENRITRDPGKFIFSTEPIEFPDLTPEKDPDFISNAPKFKLFGLL